MLFNKEVYTQLNYKLMDYKQFGNLVCPFFILTGWECACIRMTESIIRMHIDILIERLFPYAKLYYDISVSPYGCIL